MPDDCVRWTGSLVEDELLWPQALPEGTVIDLGAIVAIGTWLHGWFRARPGQAVVNAHPEVRRQLEDAGVPLLFRDPTMVGISAAERAELLDDPTPL
jgi:hypothetical protein